MSPCPRVFQPFCSATFSPAAPSTSGSHVREKAILLSSLCNWQILICRRFGNIKVHVTAIDFTVRCRLALYGAHPAPGHHARQIVICRRLGCIEVDVTTIDFAVSHHIALYGAHPAPSGRQMTVVGCIFLPMLLAA